MFGVYVLRSETTGKIYIGHTADLEKRVSQHNEISGNRTSYMHRNHWPWFVLYSETYLTRDEAKIRENQLKSSRGRAFVKNTLA